LILPIKLLQVQLSGAMHNEAHLGHRAVEHVMVRARSDVPGVCFACQWAMSCATHTQRWRVLLMVLLMLMLPMLHTPIHQSMLQPLRFYLPLLV
jgi:hypothetical protein